MRWNICEENIWKNSTFISENILVVSYSLSSCQRMQKVWKYIIVFLACISVSDFFNDYLTIHDIYMTFLMPVLIKNVNICIWFNHIHANNFTLFFNKDWKWKCNGNVGTVLTHVLWKVGDTCSFLSAVCSVSSLLATRRSKSCSVWKQFILITHLPHVIYLIRLPIWQHKVLKRCKNDFFPQTQKDKWLWGP